MYVPVPDVPAEVELYVYDVPAEFERYRGKTSTDETSMDKTSTEKISIGQKV